MNPFVPDPVNLNRLGVLMLLFLALWGCSGIRNNYPEKELFRLSAGLSEEQLGQPEQNGQVEQTGQAVSLRRNPAGSLLVQQLDISPEFETDALVYRMDENRFKSDFYHRFAVSPARMITDIVQENLFASNRFTPAGPNAANGKRYQLRGKILDLYADLRDRDSRYGVISLRLILETPAGPSTAPLVHKTYRQKIPFSPLDPDRYIQSLNQGLTQILSDFIREVDAAAL